MAGTQGRAPVIIIKKGGHARHAHHGGAWKVAYADFVTAMMAFFLVMWIIGQSSQTREGIAQYFRDPGVFETSQGSGLLPGAGDTEREVPDAGGPETLAGTADQIRQSLVAMPSFKDRSDRVQISVTADGLLIEIGDRDGDSFFESGSAELKPALVEILRVVGQELARIGNRVVVDGYTDSRTYRSTAGYDNWTLSSDRAHQARRLLIRAGVQPAQMDAVRAFADTRPKVQEDGLDPRNRRITIAVKPGGSVQLRATGKGP